MNILHAHQQLAAQSLLVSGMALPSHQMPAASDLANGMVRPHLPTAHAGKVACQQGHYRSTTGH